MYDSREKLSLFPKRFWLSQMAKAFFVIEDFLLPALYRITGIVRTFYARTGSNHHAFSFPKKTFGFGSQVLFFSHCCLHLFT